MARFNRDERKSLITEKRMPFFPSGPIQQTAKQILSRFLEPFIYLKCGQFLEQTCSS